MRNWSGCRRSKFSDMQMQPLSRFASGWQKFPKLLERTQNLVHMQNGNWAQAVLWAPERVERSLSCRRSMANSVADKPGFKTRKELEAARSCSRIKHALQSSPTNRSSSQRRHLRNWCIRPSATRERSVLEVLSSVFLVASFWLQDSPKQNSILATSRFWSDSN